MNDHPESSKPDSPFPPTSHRCDCRLCQQHRRANAAIESRDTDTLISLVNELQEENMDVGSDACYYKSIVEGTWPNAIELLEEALKRAREKEVPSSVPAGEERR